MVTNKKSVHFSRRRPHRERSLSGAEGRRPVIKNFPPKSKS